MYIYIYIYIYLNVFPPTCFFCLMEPKRLDPVYASRAALCGRIGSAKFNSVPAQSE